MTIDVPGMNAAAVYPDWRDGGVNIAAFIQWRDGVSACFWEHPRDGFSAWALWPDGRQTQPLWFLTILEAIEWCENQVASLLLRAPQRAG